MLSQVSKALGQLFKPITTVKSDADRDPSGNAFEKFTPPKKEDDQKKERAPDSEKKADAAPSASDDQVPSAKIVPFQKQTPEEVVEAHKREIRNSQAWLSLVNLFKDSKSASPANSKENSDAYEQSAASKKGVIVDKKAG